MNRSWWNSKNTLTMKPDWRNTQNILHSCIMKLGLGKRLQPSISLTRGPSWLYIGWKSAKNILFVIPNIKDFTLCNPVGRLGNTHLQLSTLLTQVVDSKYIFCIMSTEFFHICDIAYEVNFFLSVVHVD